MKKVLLAMCAVAMFAGASFAATPIQLSLWEKIAVPTNDAVHGLELGIGNYVPELRGVQWNLLYGRTDDGKGWQASLLTASGEFTGLQTGFVSLSDQFVGLQASAVNWNNGEMKGMQWGIFNKAQSVRGVQIGLVNMTENMYGIQIGLVNYIKNSGLPIMIIANAKF